MANLPDERKIQFSMSRRYVVVAGGLVLLGLMLIALQFVFPYHVPGHESVAGSGTHGGTHPANTRLWFSIALSMLVALPLALGGAYFTAFNHVAGSFWSVTVRRLAESFFWFLPYVLLLFGLIVLFGMDEVYSHWVKHPDDPLIQHKSAWLNKPFFAALNAGLMVVWFLLSFILWKKSVGQDQDGAYARTKFMARFSAFFLVVFGLGYTANSMHISMSMDPHWFSTIWAIYIFSGLALTTFASLTLWVSYLKSRGYYGESLNENHLHDLGKYLWGHTIFWAYIGISQFLLIWYAHLPEETTFYHVRMYNEDMTYNAWAWVSLALAAVRFIIPFFFIISRPAKRDMKKMTIISIFIIFGQVLDMYWIAYPTMAHGKFIVFSWYELGPLALTAGVYMLSIGYALSKTKLIPVKDPRLEECLHWHQ